MRLFKYTINELDIANIDRIMRKHEGCQLTKFMIQENLITWRFIDTSQREVTVSIYKDSIPQEDVNAAISIVGNISLMIDFFYYCVSKIYKEKKGL